MNNKYILTKSSDGDRFLRHYEKKKNITILSPGLKPMQVTTKYGWVSSATKGLKSEKGFSVRIGQWDNRIQAMPSKDKFFTNKEQAMNFLRKKLR